MCVPGGPVSMERGGMESADREQLWHAWASRQPSSVKKDDPSMSRSCANNGIRSSEVAGAILTFCLTGSTPVYRLLLACFYRSSYARQVAE